MKKTVPPPVVPEYKATAHNVHQTIPTRPRVKKHNTINFTIVGIGASAGGLEALEQFFGNVPANSGIAFIVVQHLDPTHVGMMPELLQRCTAMNVSQAKNRLKVKPDTVYVIPPGKSMSLINGALHLFDPVEARGLRLPIDILFKSLANELHEKSVGIILSGMGSDGSLGIKAIKENNGIVLVQDPESAKFDTMPRSAIEAVHVDIVAAAARLGQELIAFLKIIPTTATPLTLDDQNQSSLKKIILLLTAQSGHDFSQYKKNTLFRRIERRMNVHTINRITAYVQFLQKNPKEVGLLFSELLIGVTSFFRDTAVWEKLKSSVLVQLLNTVPDGYTLRAWVTGCSTGEEAYSLAIVFKETLEKIANHKNINVQIFATDLDIDAINKARKGVFPATITADVSPDRLSRFFKVEGKNFRVNASIREMVVFAQQDVIKDPPFTKLDILTCRNMMIYMERELQKKLVALFNYSLNPGGILLLGVSETLGIFHQEFEILESQLRIYKRMGATRGADLIDLPSSFFRKGLPATNNNQTAKTTGNIQTLTDQLILQRFAPASVMVNEKGDILYITGKTGKYLEPVAGKANWNIYAMARDGIRDDLPSAFRKAMQGFDPVFLRNKKVTVDGVTRFVDVTLQRIDKPEAIRGLIFLMFADAQKADTVELVTKKGERPLSRQQRERAIELKQAKDEIQSMREEMQTSQEELKSTNEELQSTNEELQSTNEELTTSKEEMQSLNEELQTVNVELQSRVNDYIHANDDMKNLLNSTEIATLFLDKELNIRKFTDHATHIIKLRNTDVGRPFTDLVTDLHYPDIKNHSLQVLKTLIPIETVISTNDNRWFNIRIMPYRTVTDLIDGIVITFSDITVAKKMEIELKNANEILQKESVRQ